MPDYSKTFKRYNVTQKDAAYYEELIADGKIAEALSEFIEKYLRDNIDLYESEIITVLQEAIENELSPVQAAKQAAKVAAISSGLYVVLTSAFNQFAKIHLNTVKKSGDVSAKKIANITYKELIENFNVLTREAMSRTSQNILNSTRRMQRALLVDMAALRKAGMTGLDLEGAARILRDQLKSRFPDYQEMINSRNFLLTRDNRHLNLQSYVDMSMRTTLLNVDRDIAQDQAVIANEEVVEYFVASNRRVKEHRKICKRILGTKVMGKSLLALTPESALKYGIMTVEQAKQTKDYAMGPNCTHSIRRLSKEFLQKLGEQYAEKTA